MINPPGGCPRTDSWDSWSKGRTFFEQGCDEIIGSVDLEVGQSCELLMEFTMRGDDNMQFSGFRFGISRPVDDSYIARAVRIASEAQTALVFVGRSGEWDTEGSDLEGIALPGRQDELIEAVVSAIASAAPWYRFT